MSFADLVKEASQSLDDVRRFELDTYIAVLKHYLLAPADYDQKIVSRILLKSLSRFQQNGFSLCLCVMSEKSHNLPEVKALVELEELVETGKFPQFWTQYRDLIAQKKIPTTSTFEAEIRASIVELIGMAYTQAPVDIVLASLGLKSEAELKDVQPKLQVKSKVIAFPANEFNSSKEFKPQGKFSPADLAKVVRVQ